MGVMESVEREFCFAFIHQKQCVGSMFLFILED
jgi:hypothetical protein